MWTKESVAFLTACDQAYAAHAKLLMTSLAKHHPDVPRYLAILGHSFKETWFDELGVETFKVGARKDLAFYKPLCISRCPARRVAFLDADTCVVKPIPTVYLTTPVFIVFQETYAQSGIVENPHALYQVAPIPHIADHNCVDHNCLPNSGVVITNTDDPILGEWARFALAAVKDETIRAQVRYWDQGCLIWALHKLGKTRIVINDRRFNYPANGLDNFHEYERKQYALDNRDVLLEIEADHPGVYVVHWMGGKKLI